MRGAIKRDHDQKFFFIFFFNIFSREYLFVSSPKKIKIVTFQPKILGSAVLANLEIPRKV